MPINSWPTKRWWQFWKSNRLALKRCALALSDSDREVRMAAVRALQKAQPSWDAQTVRSLMFILESVSLVWLTGMQEPSARA